MRKINNFGYTVNKAIEKYNKNGKMFCFAIEIYILS